MRFATAIYRLRYLLVGLYVALAGAMLLAPASYDPTAYEPLTYLPPGSPHLEALAALEKAFPGSSEMSQAVIAFERRDGLLTEADLKAMRAVAQRIGQPGPHAPAEELRKLRILSPRDFAAPPGLSLLGEEPPPNPLRSGADVPPTSGMGKRPAPQGQAGLIFVSIPYNFITARGAYMVGHVRRAVHPDELPPGLTAAVTGSGGFGYDYGRAVQNSHRKALYVTLTAIVVILLVVYRAPLAAMVPLASICLAGFLTVKLLAHLQPLGLHVGAAESIFVLVLLFGAGTDYSLLLVSRYRELLDQGLPPEQALPQGLHATLPAILAAAGTNTLGLLMLRFADFTIFKTTGSAVALALGVTLLASITLTPALAGLFGRRMFSWHGGRRLPPCKAHMAANTGRHATPFRDRFWQAVARAILRRPLAILLTVGLLLGLPAVASFRGQWAYDTLASLRPEVRGGLGNSAVGVEIIQRHWPVGQVAPTVLLVQATEPHTPEQWDAASRELTQSLLRLPCVQDVRSLSQPLGRMYTVPEKGMVAWTVRERARREYLAPDARALRLTVVLCRPPLTLGAMEMAQEILAHARKAVAGGAPPGLRAAAVSMTGPTAEMLAIRAVTQADFRRVAVLALGAIVLIVLGLVRDVPLALFMVASTVLSYLATLGLCHAVFVGLLGNSGLDWKVEVFLFVVMVAVGQDYNIFLAARLAQERRTRPLKEAVYAAVVHTGPVISSCGLIMAATLGSLMAGDLGLLKQLGFAFAAGMLIDTYVVRPLLLPSFALLTGRTGR